MANIGKALTDNEKVLRFVEESAQLCQPDKIVWIDGSAAQRDALRAEACATGEMIKLNEDLLPECYLHRTAVNDVARVKTGPSSAAKTRKTPAPSTTGWTRRKPIKWRARSSKAP